MAQPIITQFNKQEYYNFLKVGKAVKRTAEGLSDFAEDVFKAFHSSLLQQHGSAVCRRQGHGKNITYNRNSQSWRISCRCGVCGNWMSSIAAKYVNPNPRHPPQICWENTNVNDWPVATQSWQLAKPFMSAGKASSCNSPADTDPAGILQLLIYFKEFAAQGLDIQKVKDVSHCISFSSHLENMSFEYIIDLKVENEYECIYLS